MAAFLNRLKIARNLRHVVIAVPTFATFSERRALLNAARIAELPTLSLLNVHSANALGYAFARRKELTLTKRTICFVDMGHTTFSITFVEYAGATAQVIYTNCDRNMGARDLDWNLVRVFAGEYKEENGEDPLKKPRTILRLLDEVEKVRRKLTSNEDIEVSIESLMSEDFERSITR